MTSPASLPGPVVRSRSAIESRPQREMDMTFRDDKYRIRTDHAQANVPTIK